MKFLILGLSGILGLAASLFADETSKKFTLRSADFSEGETMPQTLVCSSRYGGNRSPDLAWENPPDGTKTFAIVCMDVDAPGGNFIHWLVYNIPIDTDHLSEGKSREEKNRDGTMQGTNTFKKVGYDGPCPPPGKPHKYIFTIYALDNRLDLKPGATYKELDAAMEGHKLRKTQLIGTFSSASAQPTPF